MRRAAALVLALACAAALLASCGLGRSDDRVLPTRGPAASLDLDPPQYAAPLRTRHLGLADLSVRRGDDRRTLRGVPDLTWLGDGRLLLLSNHRPPRCPGGVPGECDESVARVLDLARGTSAAPPAELHDGFPAVSGGRLAVVERNRLVVFDADLSRRASARIPPYDGPKRDVGRVTDGAVSVAGSTFVRFADHTGEGDQEEDEVDSGFLRYRDGRWSTVLAKDRIVALFVSFDGRALLGLQQKHGQPCGGCVVDQQVVEIDPVSGRVVRSYGAPGGYDKQWRVLDMDKVDGRVAVRYYERCVSGDQACHPRPRGTYVFDGSWDREPVSQRTLRWWQGRNQQVQLRSLRGKPDEADGFELWWVHDYHQDRLPADLSGPTALEEVTIPGSLLRPAR